MTSYIHLAHPHTGEMLAICAKIGTWLEKKESQEAQARYNARLYYNSGMLPEAPKILRICPPPIPGKPPIMPLPPVLRGISLCSISPDSLYPSER